MFPFNWITDAARQSHRPWRAKLTYLTWSVAVNLGIIAMFAIWPLRGVFDQELVFKVVVPLVLAIQVVEMRLVLKRRIGSKKLR